jgi:hypothetical protein
VRADERLTAFIELECRSASCSRSPALMAGFNHSVPGVKGKRISCPPQYGHRGPQGVPRRLGESHCFEHGFPLIRSLRASTQRSTSVLFSFVLSLIVAASFTIRQSNTIRNSRAARTAARRKSDQRRVCLCAAVLRKRASCCLLGLAARQHKMYRHVNFFRHCARFEAPLSKRFFGCVV